MTANLINALADAFTRELRDELGPEKMAEIARRNACETRNGVCHSHDFVDANEVMLAAFVAAIGRDPLDSGGDDIGPMTQADCGLWDEAWDIAMAQWP